MLFGGCGPTHRPNLSRCWWPYVLKRWQTVCGPTEPSPHITGRAVNSNRPHQTELLACVRTLFLTTLSLQQDLAIVSQQVVRRRQRHSSAYVHPRCSHCPRWSPTPAAAPMPPIAWLTTTTSRWTLRTSLWSTRRRGRKSSGLGTRGFCIGKRVLMTLRLCLMGVASPWRRHPVSSQHGGRVRRRRSGGSSRCWRRWKKRSTRGSIPTTSTSPGRPIKSQRRRRRRKRRRRSCRQRRKTRKPKRARCYPQLRHTRLQPTHPTSRPRLRIRPPCKPCSTDPKGPRRLCRWPRRLSPPPALSRSPNSSKAHPQQPPHPHEQCLRP